MTQDAAMLSMLRGNCTIGFAISEYDLWVMLAGVLAAAACSIVGCFLVLRRMSLLGDAISHAILPGLAAAFLISHTREIVPMLIGAASAGVLAALLSGAMARYARVEESASLGVSFTTLFALGVVLIAFIPAGIDLDPSCVLYGSIEHVPLDTVVLFGVEIPRYIRTIAIVLIVNVVIVALLWKELKVVSFDAAFAASIGFGTAFVHTILVSAVAWTSVVCFEAVGSILVVAMLVAPGATAHLLTDRYPRMFVYSIILATSSAVIGYQLASALDTTAAGMMSVVAGVQFAIAALVAPKHGVFVKWMSRFLLSIRIRREDILASLYRELESQGAGTISLSASNPNDYVAACSTGNRYSRGLLTRISRRALRREGLIEEQLAGQLRLTAAGAEVARQVIRSHRMWESFLKEEVGLGPDHLHDPSHVMEHYITPQMRARLQSAYADRPDPHGKPVPPA